ncbi:MAG TPA: TPM domain-containing protein [Chitinophagaceae bacterium]|nr:TPM domain-containing protein [Chitinophagaceae bacterium]
MLGFLRKKKEFFTAAEKRSIIEAISNAEHRTSGEVRVFVESHCRYVDAIDRAAEIFFQLKMEKTDDRNAVLVYMAIKDRQLAVFGDEGIHKKVGDEYWNAEVKKMISIFNKENYAEGICQCVKDIGEALYHHFPYNKDSDKNELPDDIVFGR